MYDILSIQHLISIVLAFVIALIIYQGSIKFKQSRIVFGSIILIILILDLILQWIYRGDRYILTIIPFSLCGVTYIVSIIAILSNKPFLFKYTILSAIGAIIAIVFPNQNGLLPILNIMSIRHYLTHMMIVFAQVFMLKQLNWRLVKKDYRKVAVGLFFTGLFMFVFNLIFKTNFFYLNSQVEKHVISDIIGPWPNNLILFVVITYPLLFLMEKIILSIQKKL